MSENSKSGARPMRSRLMVLMVADMVGYSLMMANDESQAIRAINDLREKYLEPLVQSHHGEILKRMGDGWIVSFSSVSDQVRCAMEVQDNLSDHKEIKLRIGGHIGEIFEDKNDFYGTGVNLAQRLQTEAPPGGLLVSQTLHQQLPKELQAHFRDAGNFRLKNIAQSVNGFQWRPQLQSAQGVDRDINLVDGVPTIAVESFEFIPDQSEINAAATDLRDQIIERLSRRTGIRVLDDTTQAAQKATYLLQCRLRVSGNRGRLNLKFVLPSEGQIALSQSYEGDTSDIFLFCDDISEKIDADLRLQINAFDGDRIAYLPDDALSVSELRSRAANVFFQCTMACFAYACRLMDRALQLDPSDAMALAMRAESKVYPAAARHKKPDKSEIRSIEADLDRAVEMAPRSDYAFAMRSLFRALIKSEISGALADADRSISISPTFVAGHLAKGLAYMANGEFQEATPALQKAVNLSEKSPYLSGRLFFLAVNHHLQGEHNEAIRFIDRAIQLGPTQWCFHMLRSICSRAAGDEAAAAESDTKLENLPKEPSVLALRPPLPDTYRDFADLFRPQ